MLPVVTAEQVEPFRKRRAGKLSGGMKQKLALSCALIHRPEVLFLDEPTTGVDAVSRKEFWEMLRRLRAEGITILVSTPYMDEASLCDRVALMQEGRILGIDRPQGFVERHGKTIWAVRGKNMYELLRVLREFPGADSVYPFGDKAHLTARHHGPGPADELASFLRQRGMQDVTIEKATPGIEDIFMDLMKQPLPA